MNDITIDVGVYTALEIDLTEFDFTGIEKVILAFRNFLLKKASGAPLFEREFTEAGVHTVKITAAESLLLKEGARYDFNIVTKDGERYKNGESGNVNLRGSCGVCQTISE